MAAAVDDDESGTMKMLQFKTQQIVSLTQEKRDLEDKFARATTEAETMEARLKAAEARRQLAERTTTALRTEVEELAASSSSSSSSSSSALATSSPSSSATEQQAKAALAEGGRGSEHRVWTEMETKLTRALAEAQAEAEGGAEAQAELVQLSAQLRDARRDSAVALRQKAALEAELR